MLVNALIKKQGRNYATIIIFLTIVLQYRWFPLWLCVAYLMNFKTFFWGKVCRLHQEAKCVPARDWLSHVGWRDQQFPRARLEHAQKRSRCFCSCWQDASVFALIVTFLSLSRTHFASTSGQGADVDGCWKSVPCFLQILDVGDKSSTFDVEGFILRHSCVPEVLLSLWGGGATEHRGRAGRALRAPSSPHARKQVCSVDVSGELVSTDHFGCTSKFHFSLLLEALLFSIPLFGPHRGTYKHNGCLPVSYTGTRMCSKGTGVAPLTPREFVNTMSTLHCGWLRFPVSTALSFQHSVPNWGRLCLPGDISQCPETYLVVASGKGVLVASSGWQRRMVLNIPQCTGQPAQLGLRPQISREPTSRNHFGI